MFRQPWVELFSLEVISKYIANKLDENMLFHSLLYCMTACSREEQTSVSSSVTTREYPHATWVLMSEREEISTLLGSIAIYGIVDHFLPVIIQRGNNSDRNKSNLIFRPILWQRILRWPWKKFEHLISGNVYYFKLETNILNKMTSWGWGTMVCLVFNSWCYC